tara:strand:- start:4444 stop:4779 length:336 start_codon:yes stop_codon:yes gene_type:complete
MPCRSYEISKKYRQTEKGRFVKLKSNWRYHRIKCDDWDKFYYERYLKVTHCECCNLEFGNERKNFKNVDHQHSSGHIRNILCHACNSNRQKVDNHSRSVLLELHRYFILKF